MLEGLVLLFSVQAIMLTLEKQRVGELKCQKDAYCTSIRPTVLSCEAEDEKYAVILSDTVIFPTGGGQPNDTGFIDNVKVLDCQRRGLDCVHIVAELVEVGASVTVTLDWERRFDHMQQHSGQHLLSDVAEFMFGWNTSSWF